MQLHFPIGLRPRSAETAERAVHDVRSLGVTIVGVVLGGSAALHDEPHDLDLFILIEEPLRQRLLRIIEGLPVDIFIESAPHALHRVTNRLDSLLVRNVANGYIVWDPRGFVTTLKKRSTESFDSPPVLPDSQEFSLMLRARTLADALARSGVEPPHFEYLIALIVQHCTAGFFAVRRETPPGEKHALAAIEKSDPATFSAIVDALDSSATSASRASSARDAIARIFGPQSLARMDLTGPVETLAPLRARAVRAT